MCGIAGVYNFRDHAPVDPEILHRMGDVISHRGPDDKGIYISKDKSLGFSHRRLSIIDLDSGIQPMSDPSGDTWIVFNGEIYNYKELRAELSLKGCQFKTESDTEVIIHLYREYGPKHFERLNGIFAFAIYDNLSKRLILARDHFGVKPLYYYCSDSKLIFGSEIKSILLHPEYQAKLDLNALSSFLTFRYNPSPQTLFNNIKKLEAAHYIELDGEGNIQKTTYWDYKPQINYKIKEGEAIEQFQDLLEQAVKRQLVSDVPVGLFLSGGVDSAIIGYLMRKHSNANIKSFTVGFPGEGIFNELDDAKKTAEYIGSEHYDYLISQEEYLNVFKTSFMYTEEPIAEPTIPALYYVSKLATKYNKVVLSGQGADEPLAGYKRYIGEKYISRFSSVLKHVPLNVINKLLPRNESIRRSAYAVCFDDELERFLAIYSIFTKEQKEKLILPEIKEQINRTDIELLDRLYSNTQQLDDSLSKMLYMDTRKTLSDNLLIFGDKITMANSIETRVPFLDVDLIKFVESLPSNYKLKGFTHKYIHKKAMGKWLPKEIIYRKKRGFDTPVDHWLQTNLSKRYLEIIRDSNSATRKYFNIEFVEDLVKAHQQKRENYTRQIFTLLSFELWHKYYLEDVMVQL